MEEGMLCEKILWLKAFFFVGAGAGAGVGAGE